MKCVSSSEESLTNHSSVSLRKTTHTLHTSDKVDMGTCLYIFTMPKMRYVLI
jgi:hypothetical protein